MTKPGWLESTLWIICGLLIDQVSKLFATKKLTFINAIDITPLLSLQLVHNHGAAYGILQSKTLFLIAINIIIISVLIVILARYKPSCWAHWGILFILAGAFGNIIDRIALGYVIDFINIHVIPVFNFADIFINIGVGLLLIDSFKSHEKQTR